jgi:Excreted virulence factor EspC, type VII ESX diderm
MVQDNVYMQIDGLRSFAQTHADVAAGMSGLLGSGAHAASVAQTHGPIASAVHTALGSALEARQGSLRGAANTGAKLADALRQAAQAYERVDQRAANQLRSAADAVDGTTAPGGSAGRSSAAGAGPAARAGGGSGVMGQVLGQVGELGGKMAQSAAGVLQGVGQGGSPALTQLSQQLTQGVAQSVAQIGQVTHRKGGDQLASAPGEEPTVVRHHEARPANSAAAGPAPAEGVTWERNASRTQ